MNSNEKLLIGVIALLAVVPAILIRGWVLVKVWTWFLIDLGAPVINIPQGLGIALICNFVIHTKTEDNEDDSYNNIGAKLLKPFIVPLASLLMALVIKQFL